MSRSIYIGVECPYCDTLFSVRIDHWKLGYIRSCGCLHKKITSIANTNPNVISYKNYGGRGITVCKRWREFINFFNDMGSRPLGKTLDRINNEGNYEPENCRWATAKQQ